jgi:hypothetical protein
VPGEAMDHREACTGSVDEHFFMGCLLFAQRGAMGGVTVCMHLCDGNVPLENNCPGFNAGSSITRLRTPAPEADKASPP